MYYPINSLLIIYNYDVMNNVHVSTNYYDNEVISELESGFGRGY